MPTMRVCTAPNCTTSSSAGPSSGSSWVCVSASEAWCGPAGAALSESAATETANVLSFANTSSPAGTTTAAAIAVADAAAGLEAMDLGLREAVFRLLVALGAGTS